MKALSILTSVFLIANICMAQDSEIVRIMDALRAEWDTKVQFLSSYDDLRNLCGNDSYRRDLVAVLNTIHHYDTTLYEAVMEKYTRTSDPVAKATLDDIEALEANYTTRSFMIFVRKECQEYKLTENGVSKEGTEYEANRKRIEMELIKYLPEITRQIDLIDEHAHHLKL